MIYYLKIWDNHDRSWRTSSYLGSRGVLDINEAYRAMAYGSKDNPAVHYCIVTDPNQPTEPPHVLH